MTDLPSTKSTISYTGASQTYTVASAGVYKFKLWGGGGGGSIFPFFTDAVVQGGGGGGFTIVSKFLFIGDTIKIDVGGGGKVGTVDSGTTMGGITSTGGAGGWPDGGPAGANNFLAPGGGGGSTRVWVNSTLIAVAGAGGGCGCAVATDQRYPGAGGGTTGQDGKESISGKLATGGSQSAGGVNQAFSSDASYKGGSLQGGNGFGTGGSTTAENANNGGGGGGGYFGGAGAGDGNIPGGGGGSGYLASGLTGSTTQGNLTVAAGTGDADYPGSIGNGGAATKTSPGANGQNGSVVVQKDANANLALDTKTNILYSGAATSYYADRVGTLVLKIWGAGGGGAGTGANKFGGGGGYTTYTIGLQTGDVVKFYPGRGGWPPVFDTSKGGTGGDPDGGYGGFNTSAVNPNGGGGGASSRAYVNDVLVAVAGGGGGGHTASAGNTTGGPGGGTTGGDGAGSNTTVTGKGGTQSAGGAGGASGRAGASLLGGNGSNVAINSSTASPGGGGGGGYFGGGGGAGNSSTLSGPGGGGSGFVNTTATGYQTGTTTAGTGSTVANSTDPDMPSGVGHGGDASGANNDAKAGGPGAIVYFFSEGTPASTFGDIGTVTMTAGLGSAQAVTSTSGDLATVTMVAPAAGVTVTTSGDLATVSMDLQLTATAVGGVGASGEIGTVAMEMRLGGQGLAEALVNVPLSDNDITFVEPEATASGPVVLTLTMPGPIALTVPRAYIPGHAASDPFEHSVMMSAPTGIAEDGIDALSTPFEHSIITSISDGAAAGSVNASAYDDTTEGVLRFVFLTEPHGFVTSGDVNPSGELGTITLTQPDGVAEEGVEAFTVGFEHDITLLSNLSAVAGGSALAHAVPNSNEPGNTYLSRVEMVSNLDASATGAVDFAALEDAVVLTMIAPAGVTKYGATVLASIIPAIIHMKAPLGLGGPTIDALGVADIGTINLTAPDGYIFVDTPGWAKLLLKRTGVSGRAPETLERNEIALNEADGVLYTRDDDDLVQSTPLAAIQAGAEMRPGENTGDFLRGDGSWGLIQPTYNRPVRLPIPPSTVVLAESIVGDPSEVTLVESNIYYRPFFIAKVTTVTGIGIEITTPSEGAAVMGLCRWNLTGQPGEGIALGGSSTSTGGGLSIGGTYTLEPGWYAAMVSIFGEVPGMLAFPADNMLAADFTLQGDPYGVLTDTIDPLPAVVGYSATSYSYVFAEVS